MKKRKFINLAVLMAVLISLIVVISNVQAQPGIIYVDLNANGLNKGTSWEDAFTNLNDALASAIAGDEIWVAAGVYYPGDIPVATPTPSSTPTIGPTPTPTDTPMYTPTPTATPTLAPTPTPPAGPSRAATFQLKSGVAIYGGFAGTEDLLSERDWTSHVVTLSGDIGMPGVNADNSYHVVTGSGVDTGAILDGFTITSGNADGIGADGKGGGMYNSGGSPTLNNIIFSSNRGSSGDGDGGGMYNDYSNPVLMNVTFSNNYSQDGGGMYNANSNPMLTDVIFDNNSSGWGAGIFNDSSSPILNSVNFLWNNATFWGGGILNYNNSSPTLTDITFSSNSADLGGGMHNDHSSPTLTDVTFSGNMAPTFGGGIYNNASNPILTHIIFSGNTASASGGGMYSMGASLKLTDVTFSSNSASNGGGMYNQSSNGTLTGVTFLGNSASSSGGGMYNYDLSSPTLTNVRFAGNTVTINGGGMVNNLNSSPILTNASFSGNAAQSGGGMFNDTASNPILTNVTFSGNSGGGGGMYNYYSSPVVYNSIFWGDGSSEIANDPRFATVSYSIVQGGYTGTGNLNIDPHFITPVPPAPSIEGDLYLGAGSPAINAGSNLAPGLVGITTDLAGSPRIIDIVDMGAFEYQVPNQAPQVSDDRATLLENTPVTIHVLSNDSDPDGQSLSVISTSQAVSGTLIINADNTVTYNPQPGFYGFDVFSYTASDGFGGTGTAWVELVPANDTWTRAYELTISSPASVEQTLDRSYQSRWYKFNVLPGSQILVTLTDLPVNYNLTLYRDIAASFKSLLTPQDLVQLSAEFSPDMFSPDMFSPDMFSPDMFSPDMFSPDMFSPEMFSPDMFSPDMFSPDMFSPDMFSPDMFSPDMFSPDMFSPDMFSSDMFSPDMFSPDMFSPDMFSPDAAAFASAQLRSMLAVSAGDGTAAEGIRANSWNNSGEYYIRVSGSHGAFDPDTTFHLEVTVLSELCGSISPTLPPSNTFADNGNYRTILLTDLDRMTGTDDQKNALATAITNFTGRDEVEGVWVDVGLWGDGFPDARVAAANTLADANPGCPYAKNLVAESIKGIINSYIDAGNPLEYIVLIGNDDVIPFFRYSDNALLANEMDYSPPVAEGTASQASLKLGYVLGQDEYGSKIDLIQKSSIIPVPDLAVGRLVETPPDVMNMLYVYSTTPGGNLSTPTTGLVTGYDFLADAATGVKQELQAGLGSQIAVDNLITNATVAPQLVCQPGKLFDGQCSWTAAEAWSALLSRRHDIIFLAGHFSANTWQAADNQTRLRAVDLDQSNVDLVNALIFSAGCHSGYNIVNEHAVPGVTQDLDWAQVFARKGATFIGGTGYQYGDTDFMEYSERLYLEFARQLRLGTGPVSLGKALFAAKQQYLTDTAEMSGIHEKSLLEATLFGLPMISLELPYGRTVPETDSSIATDVSGYTEASPGQVLGLSYVDLVVEPELTPNTVLLNNPPDYEALYLSGKDGVLSNPSEPVLPLEMYNVSVANTVLRGVGFRGGSYSDTTGILSLTGSAATEIRGVHTPFITDYFYPVLPWNVNYYGPLIDGAEGTTRLVTLPAQYKSSSPTSITGILRQYENMAFRLYYSGNTQSWNGYTPAQAAPPLIADISAVARGSVIDFRVTVVGDLTAGIQDVWIVYTIEDGLPDGLWQSVDLIQDEADSRIWSGSSLPLPGGISALDVRYMVQAVNGVGLVAYATNQGAYYTPGMDPGAPPPATQIATQLTLEAPDSAAYGTIVTLSATLTSAGDPVGGQSLAFGLGAQRHLVLSDSYGQAEASFLLLGLTGEAELGVSFEGTEYYAPASVTSNLTIEKQGTQLSISPLTPQLLLGDVATFSAALTDAGERRLPDKTVLFEIREMESGDLAYSEAVATDYTGQARLILPAQLIGQYTLSAQFGGAGLPDPRYLASSSETVLTVIYDFSGFFQPVDNPPFLNRVKAGNAVPIDFGLAGDQGIEILNGAPIMRGITCDNGMPTNDLTEAVMAGSSRLLYDALEDHYIYVWKTSKQWVGTCQQFILRLVDGTEHVILFKFK